MMRRTANDSGDNLKCSECGFGNLASHKFCSNCGARLAAAVRTEDAAGRRKAQDLIEEAFREFERENLGEAILLGEAAVAVDPANASAFSLLGTIYEKRGQVAEAIRCFERVVELNPDSEADRERLEAVRLQSMAMTTSVAKISAARSFLEKNSSFILVAVATAIVVFLIMLPIVLLRGRDEGRASTSPEQAARATGMEARPIAPPPSQAGPTGSGTTAAPIWTTPQGAQPATTSGAYGAGTTPYATSGLPPVLSAEPWETGGAQPGAAGERTVEAQEQPGPAGRVARQESPSITLTFHEAGLTGGGVSGGTPDGTGRQETGGPLDLWALGNRARTYQGSGMYRDAIDSYSRIMDAAPSGRAAQQLAICYQRVGDQQKAREAFSAAIRLFNEDVSAGRNTEEAQQGIRSCEAGLGMLGGG